MPALNPATKFDTTAGFNKPATAFTSLAATFTTALAAGISQYVAARCRASGVAHRGRSTATLLFTTAIAAATHPGQLVGEFLASVCKNLFTLLTVTTAGRTATVIGEGGV